MYSYKKQPYKKVQLSAVMFKYLAYIAPLFVGGIFYFVISQFMDNSVPAIGAFAVAVWCFFVYSWMSKKAYDEIERRNAEGIFE